MLIDAFVSALELRKQLREGTDFCAALTDLSLQIETLEDDYPEWHPAPYSFHEMLKIFVYLKVTGDNYRSLTCHPELTHAGLYPDDDAEYPSTLPYYHNASRSPKRFHRLPK